MDPKVRVTIELPLPKVPLALKKELLAVIDFELTHRRVKWSSVEVSHIQLSKALHAWLWDYISPCGGWYALLFKGDPKLHKDVLASTRLSYYLGGCGESIKTQFYEEDKKTLLEELFFKEDHWYLVKTDIYHTFTGMPQGLYRKILTTQLTKEIIR